MEMTDIAEAIVSEEEVEAQLPVPVGYRVLIALPQVEETFDGTNLLKTDTQRNQEHVMSIIGLVVDMGDQAYSDAERFPTGPWCKQGDYVMFRANSGTRFRVDGLEYRLMNDDSIEAVVADPRGVSRV
jgi:co-chaperonin GroES (HSP10)|tara:strand:- start:3368 stop:3751 length:384 start_codon:yes stop_codon:yes gene_type:complete